MMRLRTTLAMALVSASLAVAPFGVAVAKGNAEPPGAAKAPKEDKGKKEKKDKEHAHADNPGHGHDKSEKGRGASDEASPSGKGTPPGLERKLPGHPSEHGDEGLGKDGQRSSELSKKEKDGTLTEAEKTELEGIRAHSPRGGAARKARTDELEQKQTKGPLTDEEKSELARLQKQKERFEGLKGKHEKRKADREKRRLDSKREALRRFPGYEKNTAARDEFKKHAQRLAKLERAKDVAEAEERPEVVARIDKLIAKEKERHDKWLTKHATVAPQGGTP